MPISPSIRPPARRTAVALRHVAFEDLGLLEPLLVDRGYDLTVLDAGVDDLAAAADVDLLIVLGGPVGVGDVATYPVLGEEIALLRARLSMGDADPLAASASATPRPTLGICLGAQLMAAALDAEVRPTGRVEIGYGPLTLTTEGAAGPLGEVADAPVLHWHGDAFAIPAGADHLAATPGFPNQAFALGATVLGLQFHLETDPARLEQWLIGHSGELAAHGIDPHELRAQAREHGPALAEAARRAFARWLDALPV
ncbi:glutamine amidotransferase [Schumannella luteola]|uniref:GMP synthase (Glutamine-hydrolyzing) n=1 Tax=Schumannella luteola TaxID=472059 RepID=A0A852Y8W5_9MICO|nr:glutamine amidotransferase [Schumannella luteola]NYG97820.1 GMP synthase (glutamine-hydrolyzing) [Schumannella luteola]TPX02919.1 glutamine amidotransferase [Schumannella luteola]